MNYLWLDLETTGLDPHVHGIIECAAILTDEQLVELDRFETFVRYDEHRWSIQAARMHVESGLIEAMSSEEYLKLPDDEVLDGKILAWMSRAVSWQEWADSELVLAGNSVHFDRGFIKVHLPSTEGCLSHRHFDVSVLRDLAPLWWPDLELPEQKKPHRAMPDIEQALNLARFFKEHIGPKGFWERVNEAVEHTVGEEAD
jgi:oligoribonuclease